MASTSKEGFPLSLRTRTSASITPVGEKAWKISAPVGAERLAHRRVVQPEALHERSSQTDSPLSWICPVARTLPVPSG